MDKLDMKTASISQENIKKIKELFPNAVQETVAEGKYTYAVDFDALKQELSESLIEAGKERYQMTWPGKRQATVLANTSITDTLRPCKEKSVDFDNTQNIYIEGDNLKVLKLLRETYLGKIKMIYIDPPYNTGNDSFVYNDCYSMDEAEFLKAGGYYDEDGNRVIDVKENKESNGRFHTEWLNMLYPRLRLARDLLTDDGVIFISIDDNEQANLKKICDEIFGESNFVAQIVWERAYSPVNLKKHFSESHDYIVCYAKNLESAICNGLPRSDEANERYSNPDNDPRGAWKSADCSVGPVVNEKVYEITLPSGRKVLPPAGRCWVYTKERFNEMVKDNRIWFGVDGNSVPAVKKFLSEVKQGMTPMTIWKYTEVGHSQDAAQKLKKLFDGKALFDYPKSVELIKRSVQLYSNKDSIILDFFSGSATTAHAVMQLNAEERRGLELSLENLDRSAPDYQTKFQELSSKLSQTGKRKFIMVQLPEPCDEKSEAFKAGYKNICEIGEERIRRAGRKILELSLESLEKEGVIEKYAGKLSEIRSLEEVYGAGRAGISADKTAAAGRDVCTGRSNASGGGFDTVEHSGRASSRNTGIYPIFESGKGIESGTGNTIVTLRSLEVLNRLGYRVCLERFRGDKQNDIGANYISKLQALNAKLSLDVGFRVLQLDSSNMQEVYYNSDKMSQSLLDSVIDNIKPDRTPLDLLFQVMLDLGVVLSAKIEEEEAYGKTYYAVNGNDIIVCFDDDINEEVITEIAKKQPLYAVFKDKSFATDSVAINNEQLFKTYSPTTIIKVI